MLVTFVKRNQYEVKALPQFFDLFKNSTTKSRKQVFDLTNVNFDIDEKGKTHLLLRKFKRKRNEMEDDVNEKLREQILSTEKAKLEMEDELLKLVDQVEVLNSKVKINEENNDTLHTLFKAGVIDTKIWYTELKCVQKKIPFKQKLHYNIFSCFLTSAKLYLGLEFINVLKIIVILDA
jgi:hypothetical protein